MRPDSSEDRSVEDLVSLAFCESVSVYRLGESSWSIGLPFLQGDGDALPLIVERSEAGWTLTDRGGAAFGLAYEDFEFTDARVEELARIAERFDFVVDKDLVLSRTLSTQPEVWDLGDFVQLVSQVGALASIHNRPPRREYVTDQREQVASWVPAQHIAEDWFPDIPDGKRHRCDLRLDTEDGPPVALFIAGDGHKLLSSAISARWYRDARVEVVSLIPYRPGASSPDVFKAQTEVGDDQAVMPLPPSDPTRLRRVLEARGVVMA